MATFDRNVKRRVKLYPYRPWFGVIGASGAATSQDTNNPPEQQIASLPYVGVEMNTGGDMISMLTDLPRDFNWNEPLGVRVVYQTGSGTAADTIDWIVLYDTFAEGTAIAAATTALDTAISQDTVTGTAQALEVSPRGVLDANTFTESNVTGLSLVGWKIEMDAKAGGLAEDIIFLGMALDYVPKDYLGQPRDESPSVDQERL